METQNDLMNEWYRRVAVTQYAHYLSANHFGTRNYWLGIPTVILSAFVGTSVFATIQAQPEIWLQIVVGISSIAAAVLASLQTLLGYSERAEKHRIAGAKYGSLGRQLEQFRTVREIPSFEQIADIREHLDNLAIESPNNPLKIYRKAGATKIDVLPGDAN